MTTVAASTEESALRPFVAADFEASVELLVHAFFDDPALGWVLSDARTRAHRMRWLMRRWLRVRRRDELLVVDGGRGILLSIGPTGEADVPLWTQVKAGLLGMPFVFGAGPFRRFLAVDDDLKRRHAEELSEPHAVIDILAVDPSAQGQGWGTRLLGRFLAEVDRQRLPSYLVTHNPRNLGFYQRVGFEVIREAPIAPGAVPGWSMRRPPR